MKKFLAVLLALCMVFAMSSVAMAAEGDVAKIGETEYATFAEAMNAANAMTDEDVIVDVYGAVEFTNGMELKGGYDSITFIGKTDAAQITINQTPGGDYLEAHGKFVAFNDLKLAKANPAWSGNSGHMGNYFSVQGGTVYYNNCIFLNGACTSGGTAVYEECTFNNTSEYGLWVYDDALVTVKGGTIDSKKGIKVYSEGEESVTSTLTVENATFTEKVTAKPAVAIGYAESVTLIGNTYKNETGILELDSGTDADCEGVTFVAEDAEGNDISSTVTAVDRSNGNAACGVLVDGKIYTTVTKAAAGAEPGSEVTLLYNSTETVELDSNIALNKNGYEAGSVTVKESDIEDPAAKIVKASGKEILCPDLKTAISWAKAGDTVTLLSNITLEKTVTIADEKSVVLDLNGKTIDYDPEVWVYGAAESGTALITVCFGGDLTIEDNSEEKTGTLDASYSEGFSISKYDVYSAVMMTAKGDNAENGVAKLTVNSGTLKGFFAAVAGNKDRDNTEIIINGGKLTAGISESYATVGIEHPMNGKLTVNGGTIEGMDGISLRSGTLLVTGGTIVGYAPEGTFDDDGYWDNDFAACTGHALQIVNRQNSNSANETPSVKITGGNFVSENAAAVASYAGYKGETPDTQITEFISGGTYSDNSAEAYLAEGYVLESYEDADGNTVYGVEPTYTVTITIPEGAAIVVKDADGKEVEANEDKTYTLVDGTYTYTVTKDGYKAATKEFTVAGKALELTVTLEENSAPAPGGPGNDDPTDEPTKPVKPEIFPEKVFEDVKVSDWFYGDVKFCMENGLMVGMTKTSFEPDTIATRGMIVTMLYRLEGEPAVSEGAEIKFTDLEEDEWYTDAVIWAAQNEILFGYTDGTCRPDERITREQMACFLYRYADMKDAVPAGDHDITLAFPADGDTVSEWAVAAMSWATGTELIKGYGDGVLAPQDFAKRSQVAAVFQRLITGPLVAED